MRLTSSPLGSGSSAGLQLRPETETCSPKIKQLANKWSDIQKGIDRHKQNRSDAVADDLLSLEERLQQSLNQDDQKFKVLREQLGRLEQNVLARKKMNEKLQSQKENGIKSSEDNLIKEVKQERNFTYAQLARLKRQTEQALGMDLGGNFAREELLQVESGLRTAWQKVHGIQGMIRQQRRKREEHTTAVTEAIQKELNSLQAMVMGETRNREENRGRLFRLLEEISSKLVNQMESQRRSRTDVFNCMLTLLEETCRKVEKQR